ncbi:MATE family efflux transporter [Paenibacillus sp. CAU 1782]
MRHEDSWGGRLLQFCKVFWPILVTQVGLCAMNLADTIMSGRAGTDDLAGVAIGSGLWMPVITGFTGILVAIMPIVSQLTGSGRQHEIPQKIMQSLYASILISLLIGVLLLVVFPPILGVMGLEAGVEHIAYHYMLGLLTGIVPLFAFTVLRNFIDAQGYTFVSMLVTLFAVPFNVLLNYGLIFGNLGMPRLGGIGAGYATAITYWLILIINVILCVKLPALARYRLFQSWPKPSFKAWKELFSIGIPIGLSIFFEVSLFSVVTLIVGGLYDKTIVAAHQIALNFSSLVFMIPLSISMALTIVVGFSVGGGRIDNAKRYALLGAMGGIGFMGLCAIFMYFNREGIVGIYTNDAEVAVLAVQFLMFAIIYQLSDAAQASLQGVLRGYKDVRATFLIAFVSYWLIGMPSGYTLSVTTEMGPFSYWVGIIIGLTCAAAGFMLRLRSVQRRAGLSPAGVN